MADAENLKVTVTLDDESKELLRAIRDAVTLKAVEDAGRVRRLVEDAPSAEEQDENRAKWLRSQAAAGGYGNTPQWG